MKPNQFTETAHSRLVFREDDIPTGTPLLRAIKRIGILASVGEYIFIEGPFGSGKRQLADAVAKFRGARLISCDCTDDRQCPSDEQLKNDDNGVIVFVPDLEKATEQHQKWILGLLQPQIEIGPTIILAAAKSHQSSPAINRFLSTLRNRLRYNSVILPSLHERSWDIPPLVVWHLIGTGVKYITYNALDFLITNRWPENTCDLEKIMQFLAVSTQSAEGSPTITLLDIKDYYPPTDTGNVLPIDPETGESIDLGYSYESGKRVIIDDPEEMLFLRRIYLFMWVTGSKMGSDPSLNKWMRRLNLEETEGSILGMKAPLSREWLKNVDHGLEHVTTVISYDEAERVLFDIEKMYEYFEDILPDRTKNSGTPQKEITILPDIERDPDYDKFIAFAITTITTSNNGYDDHPMKNPLRLAWDAAKCNPSVSILLKGESGTGKKLFARVIHKFSTRKSRPFVPVNCAAIPSELIESELFGHEKGAFTGATGSKKGKFQEADGGILFLDEIGDMSCQAQAKILQALENGEIYPVGSPTAIKVDVQVLAATNKNLSLEIENGQFRQDLYYRSRISPSISHHCVRVRKTYLYSWSDLG